MKKNIMKKNDDYAKYLKYKMKYINAKNNLVGGNTTSILFKIIHIEGEDEYELKQLTEFSISFENKADKEIINETILNLDKMSIRQVKEILSMKLYLNKDKLQLSNYDDKKKEIVLQDWDRIEDVIKDNNIILIKPLQWGYDKYRKIYIVPNWEQKLFIYISEDDLKDIKKIIKRKLGYKEEVPLKYYLDKERKVLFDENIFKGNITFTTIFVNL
jgi:hypothetical protein